MSNNLAFETGNTKRWPNQLNIESFLWSDTLFYG